MSPVNPKNVRNFLIAATGLLWLAGATAAVAQSNAPSGVVVMQNTPPPGMAVSGSAANRLPSPPVKFRGGSPVFAPANAKTPNKQIFLSSDAAVAAASMAQAKIIAPKKLAPAESTVVLSTTTLSDPMQDPQVHTSMMDIFQIKKRLQKPDIAPADLHSLLFTPWQYALLQEAKRGFTSGHAAVVAAGGAPTATAAEPKIPSIPEISLGGIVYRAPKDWTIWLNGVRMAPDSLPKQVLDIKVTADHIDLKWFDSATNVIYPIRLRPHQRFNLLSRVFLPGIGKN